MSDKTKQQEKTDEQLIQEITGGHFARVFKVNGNDQLLVQWNFDAEEDAYELTFDFRLEDCRARLRLQGLKLKTALTAFMGVTPESAEDFYQTVTSNVDDSPLDIIINK